MASLEALRLQLTSSTKPKRGNKRRLPPPPRLTKKLLALKICRTLHWDLAPQTSEALPRSPSLLIISDTTVDIHSEIELEAKQNNEDQEAKSDGGHVKEDPAAESPTAENDRDWEGRLTTSRSTSPISTRGREIMISNISTRTKKQDILKYLRNAGRIDHVSIERSKGIGYVVFNEAHDAKDAVRILDKMEILGRRVSVKLRRGRTFQDKQLQRTQLDFRLQWQQQKAWKKETR